MLRDDGRGSIGTNIVAVVTVVCALGALYAPLVLR